MSFCRKCGKEISSTDSFCPFCGAKTEAVNFDKFVSVAKSKATEATQKISMQTKNIDYQSSIKNFAVNYKPFLIAIGAYIINIILFFLPVVNIKDTFVAMFMDNCSCSLISIFQKLTTYDSTNAAFYNFMVIILWINFALLIFSAVMYIIHIFSNKQQLKIAVPNIAAVLAIIINVVVMIIVIVAMNERDLKEAFTITFWWILYVIESIALLLINIYCKKFATKMAEAKLENINNQTDISAEK